MTLLVMAAGMGSRYGGLKQLDPIGPNGEFILDYTVYDALKAGFDKVVFVIKEENLEIFKETVGNRIGSKVEAVYCFQDLNDMPEGFSVPEGRAKQWGTAHAVLAARNVIDGPFAAVNADDFYGRESFDIIASHMKANPESPCCMAGFILKNTLTENGSVARGECTVDESGNLVDICEHTKIMRLEDGRTAYFENDEWIDIDEDCTVSMNCWGLPADFFKSTERGFVRFLQSGGDEMKKEYYLPTAVKEYLAESGQRAKVLKTGAKWYGVTYKEDRQTVVDYINKSIEDGIYPKELWKE
ncbi:MAG: nucleotidyltransferase [Clostridia bacterium]|nr:nucleotidyltransferase [Clostridia bacterium]